MTAAQGTWRPARARAAGPPVVRLAGDETAIRRWAGPIAATTRLGYAGSDPVPGLPPPDGAHDTARDVAADLRSGTTAWLALGPDGTPVGAVRVRDHGPRGWEIRRVATVRRGQRRGVARRILAEVERAALEADVPRIWLDAVVERCLPPYYAALGYRVVDHFPSPDKPLSEVTMARVPGEPGAPETLPWPDPPWPSGDHTAVCWFLGGGGLRLACAGCADTRGDLRAAVRAAARRVAAAGAPAARLAGVDLFPHDPAGVLADVGAGTSGVRLVAADRATAPAHLMPRVVHPDLLAFWRTVPGRETDLPFAASAARSRR
ncbi:GNAT family N-acetyltransferase [Actinomadura graeca]|uniref:GNAT family N-acetyltransferase n=1 Tax=Actinomadura graeca TaxID=2750812 RepID=A0ABX8QUB0_9ACTN|nr:GNAT family N-acetyltransferase [Actinomadura graeca]QXJ22394.1 GNAT family N-acetyltransferase [Actinomadura graeca]